MIYRFTVQGTAQPQGSIRNVAPKGERARLISDNPQNKAWREKVARAAHLAYREAQEPWFPTGAVQIEIRVYLQWPPSVSKKRLFPTVKPDVDKLARSILDALGPPRVPRGIPKLPGVAWGDDAQVCRLVISKHYTVDDPRVIVAVEGIEKTRTDWRDSLGAIRMPVGAMSPEEQIRKLRDGET